MYEGGRPRGFWGFMAGREVVEELLLEPCGERLEGLCCEGVVMFCGETLFEDLRLEPTRFLKRAFMDDMNRRKRGQGQAGGGDLGVSCGVGLFQAGRVRLTSKAEQRG